MSDEAMMPAPPAPRRRFRPWRLLLLLLPPLALGAGFLWFLAEATAPPADPARRTDGIAVLTGGTERVETGLRLLAEGRAPLLLVSGAHRDAGLADLARAAGVAAAPLAQKISVGHAAATTRGNAVEVAAWARQRGLRSIRVVTAGYHMPRALLELRRALPEAEFVPHPVRPAALRGGLAAATPGTWALLAGEYLKFLVARAGLSGLA